MNKNKYSRTKNPWDNFYKEEKALVLVKELNELNKECHPVWIFVAEPG